MKEDNRYPKRVRDVHLSHPLKQAVLKSVFSAKITCPRCKQAIPRKMFDSHSHADPA